MIIFYKQVYRINLRRGGGRWIPSTKLTVLDGLAAALTYKGENWHSGRPLGERLYRISRTNIAGVVPTEVTIFPDEIHDIRIVSEADENLILEYDQMIAELENERLQFIQDKFKTWRIPTKADCSHVAYGTSKEQAKKEADELNAQSRPTLTEADAHISASMAVRRRRGGIKEGGDR